MSRSMLPYVMTLAVGATVGVAAFRQGTPLPANEPGHPTSPNVLVMNRGAAQAVPIAFAGHAVVGLEPDAVVQTVALPVDGPAL